MRHHEHLNNAPGACFVGAARTCARAALRSRKNLVQRVERFLRQLFERVVLSHDRKRGCWTFDVQPPAKESDIVLICEFGAQPHRHRLHCEQIFSARHIHSQVREIGIAREVSIVGEKAFRRVVQPPIPQFAYRSPALATIVANHWERRPPLTLVNLRLNKALPARSQLAVFVNNALADRPLYQRERSLGFEQRNLPLFFGVEFLSTLSFLSN